MEESLYNKISEDMDNCRRTHKYIIKHSKNVRKKQKEDAQFPIEIGNIGSTLLYRKYFQTREYLRELRQFNICMDTCMNDYESKLMQIKDSKRN
jgi:hypothetical protein